MNFKIFKKIISLVLILTTTHVYADNLPDSLFGIKMFDSIKNYEVAKIFQHKFKDGTRSRDVHLLKYVPNDNEDFDNYYAITSPDDDKIVSVQGRIENVRNASIEDYKKKFKEVYVKDGCAARDLPKYVTAVSNVWKIRERKFSSEIRYYGKEIPENLEKGFRFNYARQLNFKKKNIKMIALLRCDYRYYAYGDLMSDGKTETYTPFISSDLWIKIMTEEYFKKFTPTKVYKNITVGNFIRQLSEGVSTKGF